MYLPKVMRSKELYKPHLIIIASISSYDDARSVTEELKKAVRKVNRQLRKKFSYEIFIDHLRND